MGKSAEKKYGVARGFVNVGARCQSGWWRDIQSLEKEGNGFKQSWFSNAVKRDVENGTRTLFWFDPWLDGGPLVGRFPRLFSLNMEKEGVVADFVCRKNEVGDGNWR